MTDQHTITTMFDDIAPHYDQLNHLLSLNIDKRWRKRLSQAITRQRPLSILDVATGTADQAIQLAKDHPQASITGIDLSEKMLEIGKKKVAKKKLEERIHLLTGDASALPFDDDSFDAVTVSFGVRNFSNLEQGLQEMLRVTKDHGILAILEFSQPQNLFRIPYRCYFNHLLPRIGQTVSKNNTAYTYLPASVAAFPNPEEFTRLLEVAGLRHIKRQTLSSGIATLYTGNVEKTT
ncbi:MAG: bifunctional demethylmenaquinone methyltransferase/2-methoxy-6-polyprenyl-1,4-benzoquinol methylase UbiE [Bacteroidales bacterium]|nr:bifunctional demethylmenaquinone methyltransferase/2-methoxy-6-polyprenyl-1,4-benzoquinol methylase UbiE [Bacteroidales bacterium]